MPACRRVTLVIRAPDLLSSMSAYLIDAIAVAPNIDVSSSSEIIGGKGDGRLEGVTLRNRTTGAETTLRADGLFVMIGAEPHTGWLPETLGRDRHGFVLAGVEAGSDPQWKLQRAPQPYETTVPGLFVVGDVRAGSVKRVAAAVGEGSVVVSQLHTHLRSPDG